MLGSRACRIQGLYGSGLIEGGVWGAWGLGLKAPGFTSLGLKVGEGLVLRVLGFLRYGCSDWRVRHAISQDKGLTGNSIACNYAV